MTLTEFAEIEDILLKYIKILKEGKFSDIKDVIIDSAVKTAKWPGKMDFQA